MSNFELWWKQRTGSKDPYACAYAAWNAGYQEGEASKKHWMDAANSLGAELDQIKAAPTQEPVMKRYNPTEAVTHNGVRKGAMQQADDGRWVEYASAAAQIAELESRYAARQRDAVYFERRVCEQSEQITKLEEAARTALSLLEALLVSVVNSARTRETVAALRAALGYRA